MKLAVISDIHGNLSALETVLQDIEREKPDKIWVLGDLALFGPRPAECVALIRERHEADKEHFQVIGGNTDRYLVTNARMSQPAAKDETGYVAFTRQVAMINAQIDWTRERIGWENYSYLAGILHRELRETVPGYGLVMGYHAIPGDDEYNITDDTPDEEALDSVLDRPLRMGIYGHIHRQVNRDLGRVQLVNPGSVGLSFDQPGLAQYALLDFDSGEPTVVMRTLTYEVDAVIQDAESVGHPAPGVLAHLLTEGL